MVNGHVHTGCMIVIVVNDCLYFVSVHWEPDLLWAGRALAVWMQW